MSLFKQSVSESEGTLSDPQKQHLRYHALLSRLGLLFWGYNFWLYRSTQKPHVTIVHILYAILCISNICSIWIMQRKGICKGAFYMYALLALKNVVLCVCFVFFLRDPLSAFLCWAFAMCALWWLKVITKQLTF